MALIGHIIKGVIQVSDRLETEEDPIDAQREVLGELLRTACNTEFGRYYGFAEILDSDNMLKSFAERVPVQDYDTMQTNWWYKLQNGQSGITWPGSPSFFALTSGTTGKTRKRIPVTDDMLTSIKDAGKGQIRSLNNFDLPPEFFEKEVLMLGSSTKLNRSGNFLEGEISGISASNIPFWFKGYYKPGEEISGEKDWDTRLQKIIERAPDWDIGSLSGIPSWIELMLKRIIYEHKLETIHDIWPNLSVYTSGGVAYEPYRKGMNSLTARPLIVIDTYLASEGFLAYQTRPGTKSMHLSLNTGIYFEFVPFRPDSVDENGMITNPEEAISIGEVEKGREYVLLISTVSGAWRYLIGDTIEFTDVARSEIRITGRTKHFLNVVGSQLSVSKLDDAVNEVENKHNLIVSEYCVAAVKDGDGYLHHWFLGVDEEPTSLKDGLSEQIAETLDAYLRGANKNYDVARRKVLDGIKVDLLLPQVFYRYVEENRKLGGQVKIKRILNQSEFNDWITFVDNGTNPVN